MARARRSRLPMNIGIWPRLTQRCAQQQGDVYGK